MSGHPAKKIDGLRDQEAVMEEADTVAKDECLAAAKTTPKGTVANHESGIMETPSFEFAKDLEIDPLKSSGKGSIEDLRMDSATTGEDDENLKEELELLSHLGSHGTDSVSMVDVDDAAYQDVLNAAGRMAETSEINIDFLAEISKTPREVFAEGLQRTVDAILLPRFCMQVGDTMFREGNFEGARSSYEVALVSLICLSRVLSVSTSMWVDPEDGIRMFHFSAHRCEDSSDEGELQTLHQAAITVRNLGITLCQLDKWAKAEQCLVEASMFRSTGMEVKTYFWKSVAQTRLCKFAAAVASIEQAESIGSFGRRQLLSKRLQRRNNKMLRDPIFGVQAAQCRVLYHEQAGGMYDFENIFQESDPGRNHFEFNLDGVTKSYVRPEAYVPTSSPRQHLDDDDGGHQRQGGSDTAGDQESHKAIDTDGQGQGSNQVENISVEQNADKVAVESNDGDDELRHVSGLVASHDYKEGDLIFVSKALICLPENDCDRAFVRMGCEAAFSSLYKELYDLLVEHKTSAKQQDLLRRFCQFLLTKNENDPAEYDMMRQTCFQIAEGMGALKDNGEIDHAKVARELMKQEALCEELFGRYFQASNQSMQQILSNVSGVGGTGGLPALLSSLNALQKPEDTGVPALSGGTPTHNTPSMARCKDLLRSFCKIHQIKSVDLVAMSNEQLEAFVQYSIEYPDVDPLGTALFEQTKSNPELLQCVLGLPGTHKGISCMEGASDEARVRRISLLHRVTSYDFKNGVDMLLSKNQCPVMVSSRRTCLWDLPSFIGHSCVPNTKRLHFGHLCFVQASQDIKKGTPLTSCYTPAVYYGPSGDLQRKYSFTCKCEFCKFGGRDSVTDPEICKWKSVFYDKVLPKFAPGVSFKLAKKHESYALKLMAKLEHLVMKWTNEIMTSTPVSVTTVRTLYRVHFLEPYYALVNALEARNEPALKVIGVSLRERRIRDDYAKELGMWTLLGRHCAQVDLEKAKIMFPLDAEAIRKFVFAHDRGNTKLVSSIMETLLCIADLPASDVIFTEHPLYPF